jgi:hypothetical protein
MGGSMVRSGLLTSWTLRVRGERKEAAMGEIDDQIRRASPDSSDPFEAAARKSRETSVTIGAAELGEKDPVRRMVKEYHDGPAVEDEHQDDDAEPKRSWGDGGGGPRGRPVPGRGPSMDAWLRAQASGDPSAFNEERRLYDEQIVNK